MLASRATGSHVRPVSLVEKQQRMIEELAVIDDPQERLSAVVDRARRRPPLPETERTADHRVRGCVSQVWLVGEFNQGRCRFRCDADSPLVRGLVLLLCDLYDDAPPAEILAVEPRLFEELELVRHLSPTRLNGLRSARATIRAFAAAQLV
jgi:cysteine desulfuration protein SufE